MFLLKCLLIDFDIVTSNSLILPQECTHYINYDKLHNKINWIKYKKKYGHFV